VLPRLPGACLAAGFSAVIPAAVILLAAAPASAQAVWIGGAIQQNVQRFAEDVVPNRLDGSAIGWRVGADMLVWRHFALAAEWSDRGAIEDARTMTLDVNGLTVPITSTFTHRTRSLAALAGYGHELTGRVRVAYLLGVAATDVRRTFTSDAATTVLVSPSTPAASSAPVEDRFPALTGGVDVRVRTTRALHFAAGLRALSLRLEPDLRGWSVETFIGAGWAF
jgi:hypothetical protein